MAAGSGHWRCRPASTGSFPCLGGSILLFHESEKKEDGVESGLHTASRTQWERRAGMFIQNADTSLSMPEESVAQILTGFFQDPSFSAQGWSETAPTWGERTHKERAGGIGRYILREGGPRQAAWTCRRTPPSLSGKGKDHPQNQSGRPSHHRDSGRSFRRADRSDSSSCGLGRG